MWVCSRLLLHCSVLYKLALCLRNPNNQLSNCLNFVNVKVAARSFKRVTVPQVLHWLEPQSAVLAARLYVESTWELNALKKLASSPFSLCNFHKSGQETITSPWGVLWSKLLLQAFRKRPLTLKQTPTELLSCFRVMLKGFIVKNMGC